MNFLWIDYEVFWWFIVLSVQSAGLFWIMSHHIKDMQETLYIQTCCTVLFGFLNTMYRGKTRWFWSVYYCLLNVWLSSCFLFRMAVGAVLMRSRVWTNKQCPSYWTRWLLSLWPWRPDSRTPHSVMDRRYATVTNYPYWERLYTQLEEFSECQHWIMYLYIYSMWCIAGHITL